MPVIKCSSCGYRHLQLVPDCVNCGAPLATSVPPMQQMQSDAESESLPASSLSQGNPLRPQTKKARSVRERNTVQRELPQHSSHEPQVTLQSATLENTSAATPVPDASSPSRQLVVKQQSGVQLRQQMAVQQQAEGPYETSRDVMLPESFTRPQFGQLAIVEEHEKELDPEHWKTARFPWFFPKTHPKIAGKVIHMESKEEIVDHPDIFAAVAMLVVELLWVLINVQQERAADRVVMTTLRVQAYDGTLQDARLRGNMRGANLSLGDEISLWGPKHLGALYVRRGYNHTTNSLISTTSMGLLVPALMLLSVFIGALYFLPLWGPWLIHTTISTFTSLFSSYQHHPISLPAAPKK